MALPDIIKLTSGVSRATGISSASVANNTTAIGSVVDNATNLDIYLTCEIIWSYTVAPAADKGLHLHLLYSLDGVNFEESSVNNIVSGVTPPADTATHRRVVLRNYQLAPYQFQLAIENDATGQTATVTINAMTHNEQIVE